MEQPPAKRHNTGYNPPPPTAEWVQTLALDHTDPQPLPDQILTCTFKDGTKKVLEARTLGWTRSPGPGPRSCRTGPRAAPYHSSIASDVSRYY